MQISSMQNVIFIVIQIDIQILMDYFTPSVAIKNNNFIGKLPSSRFM